jgi:hypothetical protein
MNDWMLIYFGARHIHRNASLNLVLDPADPACCRPTSYLGLNRYSVIQELGGSS